MMIGFSEKLAHLTLKKRQLLAWRLSRRGALPDTERIAGHTKRLVGYVVSKQGHTPTVDELREFVRGQLPDYMVPSAFVVLEAFPLTPTGKVDRRALPPPDNNAPSAAAYTAPESDTERKLAAIWQAVLGIDILGVHDNFFDRGGHSLLATQVISRLRGVFELELPVASLFDYPTVASLAAYVDTTRWAAQGKSAQDGVLISNREQGEI